MLIKYIKDKLIEIEKSTEKWVEKTYKCDEYFFINQNLCDIKKTILLIENEEKTKNEL